MGDCKGQPRSSFAELVEKFAPAAYRLEKHDERTIDRLAVVAKEFAREQAIKSVKDARTRPVLMIYSGDLTPQINAIRRGYRLNAKYRSRQGRCITEWLVHQAFYIWLDDRDNYMVKCLVDSPVVMIGKKTWDLYAAAVRFIPTLQTWQNLGIAISWYAFDRGCRDALCRLLRRRHLLALAEIADVRERAMKSLLDWPIDSACCDHDVQNGLAKGCAAAVADYKGVCKDVYKGIRSIRNVYDKLLETMPDWIRKVRITDDPYDPLEVWDSYKELGADDGLAKMLAKISLREEGDEVFWRQKLVGSG